MEEEKKQVYEQVEETENNSNTEDKILRPTISSEELLRNKESNNNHKELTSKVEQYNFNNGFKNTKQVNESLVEVKDETPLTTFQNNTEKIDIKPPKKKNKMLPIILFLIVILCGGIYYYLNFFNKKDLIKAPVEEEEPSLEEKEKQNKTTCRLAIKSETQKQNTIIEYIYYDKEEKLKAYEQNTTFEYLEEAPKSIIEECNMINKNYEGYNGYSNVCIENDELSYTFSTKVDLSKLEEKTLTFDNNTITITASLDDDTSSLKEEYESANYECVTEEIEVSEE